MEIGKLIYTFTFTFTPTTTVITLHEVLHNIIMFNFLKKTDNSEYLRLKPESLSFNIGKVQ